MRPEGNPLDLNNLPDEYSKDGSKQDFQEGSSRDGPRKKKSGAKNEKDEFVKVYECRFCSLKFCKSQALGGHMNRHRQERETETMNRARQLVFGNDNLAAPGGPQPPLGNRCCQPIGSANFHSTEAGSMGDPTLPLRFSRDYSGGSSTSLLPQPQLYSSPSRPAMSFASQHPSTMHPMNDFCVGHVLSCGNQPYTPYHHHSNLNYDHHSNNYTCIGAPVGQGFNGRFLDMPVLSGIGGGSGNGGSNVRDGSLYSSDQEGITWGRSSYKGSHQNLDSTTAIHRFHQDGF